MTVLPLLRIATRGSPLALAQADIVGRALVAAGASARVELVRVRTAGDALSEARPDGGHEATDGQFTAAVERALLDGAADLAVHSFKDLPTAAVDGLTVMAVPERADPRDCLVSRHAGGLAGLPPGATIGTGSERRSAQLLHARPDIRPVPIRGNVETRRRRVADGDLDAVVLAAAGLDRLGLPDDGDERLPLEVMLPAPAQGALAVQVRTDREDVAEAVRRIDHGPSRVAAEAERELLRRIGGGCLAPLGALVEVGPDGVRLRAAHAVAGAALRRVDLGGPRDAVPDLVAAAARRLGAPAGVPE
jgi:hydroxymethylbilane synthase